MLQVVIWASPHPGPLKSGNKDQVHEYFLPPQVPVRRDAVHRPAQGEGSGAGRELLWDKSVDRSAWSEYREAEVEQQPYVYQTESSE
jgi:hypothetical protein